jgi:phosphoribosyl 1,2-cyclic phosphodiesterase
MELRFWGVRGSIPTPGTTTAKVGGNTTCISLRLKDYIFVFDAGTGIRQLGKYLANRGRACLKGSIFLTHYHWDHIQGLPFFVPAFRGKNRFHIYGEHKNGASIYEILAEQMQDPYFPVPLDALQGLVTFVELGPDQTLEVLPEVNIRTIRLKHPNGAVGYRVDSPDGSISIIMDHEHPKEGLSDSVVEFASYTNILIHDAQYTPEVKMKEKEGWGHSSWKEAALTALEANAGRLFLTHHDPDHTDEELKNILNDAGKIFTNTEIASESTVVEV